MEFFEAFFFCVGFGTIHSQRRHVMNRFFILLVVVSVCFAEATHAATIYESGTLGPTGIPVSQLDNGTVPGTNVNETVFVGVRFELDRPIVTSQIGGHFVAGVPGTFFGAIVALDGAEDVPNSSDMSSADVLGHTELTFPVPSTEVFGDLNLSLDPGWYALVFGSGLFGTTGQEGGAIRNGSDLNDPSYIVTSPTANNWAAISTFPNHRFVVEGRIIPEPTALVLCICAIAPVNLVRRPR